jgi:hypothetical protein
VFDVPLLGRFILANKTFDMETVQAYAVSWTGLFAVLIFLRLLPLLNRLRPGLNKTFAYINYHATRHLTYRLVRRHAFVGPSTVGSVLLHIAYVAANLVCLIYGASTLSEAAIRAGDLSVVNMTPLFLGLDSSYLTDLLGTS